MVMPDISGGAASSLNAEPVADAFTRLRIGDAENVGEVLRSSNHNFGRAVDLDSGTFAGSTVRERSSRKAAGWEAPRSAAPSRSSFGRRVTSWP